MRRHPGGISIPSGLKIRVDFPLRDPGRMRIIAEASEETGR
jgi:hypothetical protein